jgi:hypothetical protein
LNTKNKRHHEPGTFINHPPQVKQLMKTSNSFLAAALATALMAFSGASANASTYSFTQGGYTDGATFSGTFKGSDFDHNGVLTQNEIWDFNGTIHGGYWNSLPIANRSNGSVSFQYNLDNNILGDEAGETVHVYYRGWQIEFYSGNGTNRGFIRGFGSEPAPTTAEWIHVTEVSPVPEPESWALLLAGVGLLGCMAKRRQVK